MDHERLDRIVIKDLAIRCIIGINESERHIKQTVVFNLTLYADLSDACRSDDINDTVDYSVLTKAIAALVEGSSCQLLERLADTVARRCLTHERVKAVRVNVDKPGALRGAGSAGVEILRQS